MKKLLKPFAALGIAWRHSLFFRARLKLTALYVAVLALIVGGFSFYLYINIFHNLQSAHPEYFVNIYSQMHFIEDTLEPIQNFIVGTDIFVIALFGLFSYWFAGKTLQPVERALEAQRLFAAKASHELRTPLTVIRNDNEVSLRDTNATIGELRETLKSGIEEIDRMTDLIEHLLLIARSEQSQLSTENIAVQDVVGDVLFELRPVAKQKNITLESESEGGLVVEGEYRTLRRTISNVVRNALEHTVSGGTVTIAARIEDRNVCIVVQDTGSGIAAEDLPHVFERFYKGKNGRNKNGSGLGLAMVKEVIDQHGGSIHIQSTENIGTTVSMVLPRVL